MVNILDKRMLKMEQPGRRKGGPHKSFMDVGRDMQRVGSRRGSAVVSLKGSSRKI